ncbi:MAG: hypothetical protein OSB21_13940, partial [Myxococcota bacterium]|nr:hypothetical protein [Myxococcota bacterium]
MNLLKEALAAATFSLSAFCTLLFIALTPSIAQAQIGNGIMMVSTPEFAFTPTSVDSTTSVVFEVINTVGVEQTVSLSGLDAPFGSDVASLVIASGDTATIALEFSPTATGLFNDTVSLSGSVFGLAELALAGNGTMVSLEWSADTLAFPTTALGQFSTLELTVTNTGDGP